MLTLLRGTLHLIFHPSIAPWLSTMKDITKSALLLGLLLLCSVWSIEGIKSAVVVGAGPAGLASALVLAQRHGYQVTILESSERTDVYDPTKAYPFLIRERGQKLTNLFPRVQSALEKLGIETTGATKLVSIPADPGEILDPDPKEIPIFRPAGKSFWIRRHEFIRLLLDAALAEERITVINGATCSKISASGDSSEIEICTDGSTNLTLTTSLLIGCDGMKSKVRESLATSPSFFPGWANNDPDGFKVKRWFSPSSGLKFKCLQINSDAKVPVGDGTMFEIPFDTQTFYSIRSVYKSPKQAISLGLLPCRKAPTRTFNVIRLPNHDIWKVKDGEELREWFAKAFPRFDFSAETSLVEQEEFDRFATTEGLSLPPCQYSPQLYVVSPNSEAAVILVGDAVHTFPPDLGEGVNSGLEDVLCLDESLTKIGKIGNAARYYASLRGPESKALVKMVRVGAPFQYQQFGGLLTVKKLFWTFNFFGRVALNKLTFGLSPNPVFIQISDPNLTYSTALRRADTLTATLWLITLGVLSKVFGVASKLKALFV